MIDLDGISLDRQLRAALANDELEVAYQPVVRGSDGLTVGAEALVRWTEATRGAVPPSVIVGVAERSDLIDEVGAWVLQRSVEDHRRWQAEHPGIALDLAINVSVHQLLAPGFVDTVADVLAATGTVPLRWTTSEAASRR